MHDPPNAGLWQQLAHRAAAARKTVAQTPFAAADASAIIMYAPCGIWHNGNARQHRLCASIGYALAAPLMPRYMPSFPSSRFPPRQQGFTLMLVLLLLGVGVGAVLFSFYSSTALTLDSDQNTADALARAKAALIAYAIKSGDIAGNPRPGDFPCPDTDNDGNVNSPCVAGRLGRIPWKELGIPEPKDASGETLWYAVAGPFRTWNSNPNPLNSDTRGNITVFASDGVTQLTTQAVAVIFAPGPALAPQNRDPDPFLLALCPTTGTFVGPILCAANYLETSAGTNNATTNGPFINGLRTAAYNDRVISITTPEFMPAVEMRVARELMTVFQAYYNTNSYYPFAAAYDDATGTCALNERRGRVPSSILGPPDPTPPNALCAGLAEWTGSLPIWFMANNWYNVIYYSVGSGYVFGGTNSCPGGVGCLKVDPIGYVPALFFMPGTPLNAAWRVFPVPDNNLAHYLEGSAENQDGWGGGANDSYVMPTAVTLDRDRVFTLAGGVSPQQCANNAAALLALTPCGQPPRLNPQCITLASNLAVCTCAAAANQIITPPCENTLNPPQCQAAVVTLSACNS